MSLCPIFTKSVLQIWRQMVDERFADVKKVGTNFFKITFTGKKANRITFQQYLDDLELCYMEKTPMVMLFDATKAKVPSLYLQKKQSDWMLIHWKMIRTYCLGTAYVIDRWAIRVVLRIIFYFTNQPVPFNVFDNEEKAIRWLNRLK
ncbi:MAG: hypothetical protein ACJAT1_000460 [Marivirga sp.]